MVLCNVYGKVAFLKKQIFLDADDWQMDQAIRVDASLKGLLYISQVKFKSYSTEQNVSHGFNVFVTIVRVPNSNVTTRVIIVI